MKVHLVDGTYELFRHFFGAPPHRNAAGDEVAAVRGVVGSVLQLLGEGATHVGVATDHVIESFRNDLWPGYKTGEGVDPDLWSQAWPLEEALAALGVLVWPMVELEADDALASGARGGRRGPGRRAGRHLHAGQGPGPVRAGDPGGAAGPPQGHPDRRGRRRRQVRGRPGLHPRLPRPRGRQRGRVSRLGGLGGQVGRHRPGPLGPHRGHPARPRRLGGDGAGRGQARHDAAGVS